MENQIPSGSVDESVSGNAAYNPTEEEQTTIRLVERLFSEAKKAKSLHDTRWLEFYKFFRGKQWPEKRPSYRHSEVINLIFAEVQNVLVLMTDQRPNIDALPEDPTDLQFAELISQILRAKWDNNFWSYVVAEGILDASIYGTAVGSVEWKPELLEGLGDFTFETEDPFYFFPDPNARNKVNDEYCDYAIRARPTDCKKLKAKYPDKAEYLTPDLTDVGSVFTDRQDLDEVRYQSPTDNRVRLEGDKYIQSGRPNQILEICCYLKSDEMVEEEVDGEMDPATGIAQKLFQQKKKYPKGRKIVIANGVLLESDGNPYDDGEIPFATLVDNILPRQMWGVGEVEQLKSIQTIYNKVFSYTLDTMSLMANPIWKVTTNSGVDTDNLTNQPSLVVEYNKEGSVEREPGVPLPPYIMQLLDVMGERIWSKLASTTETSRGIGNTDQSSGYAIAQLQEAAQTRIRGKSRNLEVWLKQIGDLMVSRILQFYTIPRVVRLTNNAGAAQYFKFHVSDATDESGQFEKYAEVSQYSQDPMTGAYVEGAPTRIPLKSRLDVRINVGSTLPFAKLESKALAEKLYDKQIIDAEEYLTQLDYPRKEKILQRMQERQGVLNANGTNAPGSIPPGAPPSPAVAGPG